MDDRQPQRDMPYNGGLAVKPVASAWRGRWKIPNRNIDIYVAAHISSKACSIVSEVASTMSNSLCLEVCSRGDVWPPCFKNVPPTEFSIDLFFFSEGRDGIVLDSLLNDAICHDFALNAKLGEVRLLIFSSFLLPEKLHKFQGKFYFWGFFMGQGVAFSNRVDSDVGESPGLSLNPGKSSMPKDKGSPIDTSKNGKTSKSSDQVERRGRRLDEAWAHAKPLDELRQKTQCKYCDFISEHGGISRLKAHLAGENPRVPQCNKVSAELKKAMACWYNKWVTDTKALWVTGSQGKSPATPKKRREEDDAWEHAIKLNVEGHRTKCSYCGFISEHGGITRMRVHLAGGHKHLGGCPNVPPHIRTSMFEGIGKTKKKTKGVAWRLLKKTNKAVRSREFHWTDNRGRILHEAFEDVKKTSLKASLQKLLDKKKTELDKKKTELLKMQSEIQSLEIQLSLLP